MTGTDSGFGGRFRRLVERMAGPAPLEGAAQRQREYEETRRKEKEEADAAQATAPLTAMSPDESVETLRERVKILMDSLRTSIKSGEDIEMIDRYARDAFEAIGKVLFDPRVGEDDPARAEADAAFKEHQSLTYPLREKVKLKAALQERQRARASGSEVRRKLP